MGFSKILHLVLYVSLVISSVAKNCLAEDEHSGEVSRSRVEGMQQDLTVTELDDLCSATYKFKGGHLTKEKDPKPNKIYKRFSSLSKGVLYYATDKNGKVDPRALAKASIFPCSYRVDVEAAAAVGKCMLSAASDKEFEELPNTDNKPYSLKKATPFLRSDWKNLPPDQWLRWEVQEEQPVLPPRMVETIALRNVAETPKTSGSAAAPIIRSEEAVRDHLEEGQKWQEFKGKKYAVNAGRHLEGWPGEDVVLEIKDGNRLQKTRTGNGPWEFEQVSESRYGGYFSGGRSVTRICRT